MASLITLLVVAAVALRGYLPGDERAPREQAPDSSLSLLADIVVLSVSLVVVALAVIAWLRTPRRRPAAGQDLPAGSGRSSGRLSWRLLVSCLAAFVMWLAVVMLLMRLTGAPHHVDADADAGAPPAPAPGQHPAVPPGPRQVPPAHHADADMYPYLAASTLIMVVLVGIVGAVAIRRRCQEPAWRPGDDDSRPAPPAADGEPLALAAARGLAEMKDLSREPREAIIACYAAMERALADAPGAMPLDSDTPSEVLARAVEHDAIHPGSATELVDLFAEARFSVHVMSERHREAAVRALQLVLSEVRSSP